MSTIELLQVDLRELALKLELLAEVQTHLERCTEYKLLVQWKREKRGCKKEIERLAKAATKRLKGVLND